MIAAILTGLSLAALGAAHCVGMCGGLIGCVGCAQRKTWWPGLISYNVGRVLTYIMLGLAVGMLGHALQRVPGLAVLQTVIAVAAGLLIVVMGLHLGGWIPDPLTRLSALLARVGGLSLWLARCATRRDVATWLGLGVANGLLPCGLVYAALGLSLTQPDISHSLALMSAFGMGTVPAMLLAPWLLNRAAPRLRGAGLRLASILIIALGLFTLLRASLPHDDDSHPHHVAGSREPVRADVASVP